MFLVDIETDAASAVAVLAHLTMKLSPAGLHTFLDTMVDPFIRARVDQRFASEGDDVVGAWHPLTVATQMIRAAKGYPSAHPINQRSHKMHSFLVNTQSDVKPTGIGATLTHPPPTGDGLMNQKIQTAQAGKSRPRTPPRPVIGVNENDMLFITSELALYLSEDFI